MKQCPALLIGIELIEDNDSILVDMNELHTCGKSDDHADDHECEHGHTWAEYRGIKTTLVMVDP